MRTIATPATRIDHEAEATTYRRLAYLFATVAAGAVAVAVLACLLLADESARNAHRREVEQTAYACLNGDRIAPASRYTECRAIVWRRADEAGV